MRMMKHSFLLLQHFETIERHREKPQKFHKSKVCVVLSFFHSILLHRHHPPQHLYEWMRCDCVSAIWRRLFGCFVVRRTSVVVVGAMIKTKNTEFELTLSRFCSLGHSHLFHCTNQEKMNNERQKNDWFTHIPLDADNNADDEETEAFQLTWWAWVHYIWTHSFVIETQTISDIIWSETQSRWHSFRFVIYIFFIGDKIWCCMRLSLSYVGRETPVVDGVNDLVILGI